MFFRTKYFVCASVVVVVGTASAAATAAATASQVLFVSRDNKNIYMYVYYIENNNNIYNKLVEQQKYSCVRASERTVPDYEEKWHLD